MKKWIGAALALALLWSMRPFVPVDAGELFTVETLLVERTNGVVTVIAGGETGTGETIEKALEQMTENAPGILFLRQVRRVIFCGTDWNIETMAALPEELPVGALLYTSPCSAQTLAEWKNLDKVMSAREQSGEHGVDLAKMKNRLLTEESRRKE